MLADQIKEVIYSRGRFKCSLVCKLGITNSRNSNYDKPVVSEYEFNDKVYAQINTAAFLNFEISQTKDEAWDKSRSICIYDYELSTIIDNLKMLTVIMKSDKLISLKDVKNENGIKMKQYVINNEELLKENRLLFDLANGRIMVLPAIVVRKDKADNKDYRVKGVELRINNDVNTCDFSIEELSYFVSCLSILNIKESATIMINTYTMYKLLEQNNVNIPRAKPQYNKGNNIWNNTPKEDTISGSLRKEESSSSFFGINTK